MKINDIKFDVDFNNENRNEHAKVHFELGSFEMSAEELASQTESCMVLVKMVMPLVAKAIEAKLNK